MFVIVNKEEIVRTEFVGTFVIYFRAIFHTPGSSGSLVRHQTAKYKFHLAVKLFHIPENVALRKDANFFRRFIFTQNFDILRR
jgi:hypothetical protein